jgi:hypothetical protein
MFPQESFKGRVILYCFQETTECISFLTHMKSTLESDVSMVQVPASYIGLSIDLPIQRPCVHTTLA